MATGSFGFNAMEFDTMVRHNIPIVCVVNNYCAWGMIKHSQEMSIGAEGSSARNWARYIMKRWLKVWADMANLSPR